MKYQLAYTFCQEPQSSYVLLPSLVRRHHEVLCLFSDQLPIAHVEIKYITNT